MVGELTKTAAFVLRNLNSHAVNFLNEAKRRNNLYEREIIIIEREFELNYGPRWRRLEEKHEGQTTAVVEIDNENPHAPVFNADGKCSNPCCTYCK